MGQRYEYISSKKNDAFFLGRFINTLIVGFIFNIPGSVPGLRTVRLGYTHLNLTLIQVVVIEFAHRFPGIPLANHFNESVAFWFPRVSIFDQFNGYHHSYRTEQIT